MTNKKAAKDGGGASPDAEPVEPALVSPKGQRTRGAARAVRKVTRHIPTLETRAMVADYVSYGIPEETVAMRLGCPVAVMMKLYREEIATATAVANAAVAQSLFHKATGNGVGAVAAAIFWLRSRGGWKEPDSLELTGANGGPIRVTDALEKITSGIARIIERRRDKKGAEADRDGSATYSAQLALAAPLSPVDVGAEPKTEQGA